MHFRTDVSIQNVWLCISTHTYMYPYIEVIFIVGSCLALNLTYSGCCVISPCSNNGCYCDQACHSIGDCCSDVGSIGCYPVSYTSTTSSSSSSIPTSSPTLSTSTPTPTTSLVTSSTSSTIVTPTPTGTPGKLIIHPIIVYITIVLLRRCIIVG